MPVHYETPRLLDFKLIAFPARQLCMAPNRPLDWRWQRAKYLAENDIAPYDGELIHHCRKYHLYRREGGTRKNLKNGFFELMDRIAEIDQQPSLTRLIIRCGIATRLSSRMIGELAQVPTAVVTHYRKLKFDLGPGSAFTRHFDRKCDVESVAICHCHYRGKLFIPIWQDYFEHIREVHDLDTAIGRQREQVELLLLSRRVPPAITTQEKIIAIRQVYSLPPTADRIFTTPEILLQLTQRSLRSLTWGTPRPVLDPVAAAVPATRFA